MQTFSYTVVLLSTILKIFESLEIIQVNYPNATVETSNSWIIHDSINEGFIIDCGCYWLHGLHIARTWRQHFAHPILPKFIILTHTHPDHLTGLVSLLLELNVTRSAQLPVYVSSQGDLTEMNHWLDVWRTINPFENSVLFDIRQSPASFSYNNYVRVLDRPIKIFDSEDSVVIIGGFLAAESLQTTLLFVPPLNALFTGGLVAVKSHLWTNIFLPPYNTYPGSDQHICNWIGALRSIQCVFPSTTVIYPGYGLSASDKAGMSFNEVIDTNLNWLISMRKLAFNSCNKSFVMEKLMNLFPNFTMVEASYASLSSQVPLSAIGLGCKCNGNMPDVCAGLVPPTCPFVPYTNKSLSSQTTQSISCMPENLKRLSSDARKMSLEFLVFAIATVQSIFKVRSFS
ncbi:unnamed protein product [Didymodactylos carnosus]|uniref:Metallo-beta-lactamase domain-containing protein n=1 Tax=Didymodactylos carnosus TaxID=1234261 RepID=A0A814SPM0_9BILA|nr:unnamed protein product [Didymodactylos carnosus]CAF3914144.1 unnamed protein product [Didymodactylos carnosus]